MCATGVGEKGTSYCGRSDIAQLRAARWKYNSPQHKTLFEENRNVSMMLKGISAKGAMHACHSENAENFKLKLFSSKYFVCINVK
jgi:hypothetical protein